MRCEKNETEEPTRTPNYPGLHRSHWYKLGLPTFNLILYRCALADQEVISLKLAKIRIQ